MQYTYLDRLHQRELGSRKRYAGIKGLYGDRQWIRDMDIVNELDGHSGCVNALSWSKNGKLLASGSDDQNVNIHTYQSDDSASPFRLATSISTGHSANIFSVKFMPHSNDRTIISAAGDAEIRIFDIEYDGKAEIPAAPTSRRAQGLLNKGVQHLSEGDTNCRVYRSHSDRVKRIVTESSPHLFLTCSEDGEVRQWDLRQPSSAYPRPRGAGRWGSRDEPSGPVPPPLISYKKWRIDLNTISCSGSQPHYIALGGAHLHCFLHDRRMLSRDRIAERGGTPSSSGYSDHDDEAMGEATQCVKRFAPNGQQRQKSTDNGHITACKISDANPNEMVVSWSGDWIYNFDLLRSPDAREQAEALAEEQRRRSNKLKQAREKKRKRTMRTQSGISEEGIERGSSQPRIEEGDEEGEVALRVRYQNGQSENIPVRNGPEVNGSGQSPSATSQQRTSGAENVPAEQANAIATQTVSIREALFDLQEQGARTEQDPTGYASQFSHALELADPALDQMDDISKQWRYPVDPDELEVAYQRTLRAHRESARRFVQAAGTLSRLLGGDLPQERRTQLFRFAQIRPTPNEQEIPEARQAEQFSYDFLKAIVLWLTSGPGGLVEGFTRQPRRPGPRARFPVPPDYGIAAIEEIILPYLTSLAGTSPVYDIDSSRFEVDTRRILFGSEVEAVEAFAKTLKRPFEDLVGSGSSDVTIAGQPATQARAPALGLWGFRVGRSLLHRAGEGLDYAAVDRAFGGLGSSSAAIKRRERVLKRRVENIVPEEEDPEVEDVEIAANVSGEDVAMNEDDDDGEENDEDMIAVEDLRDIIMAAGEEGIELEDDQDEADAEMDIGDVDTRADGSRPANGDMGDVADDDDDDDEDDNDEVDDDDEPVDSDEEDSDDGPRHRLFHSAAERRTLRSGLHNDVPCATHTRRYTGHCNVKTVKDVNFFGLDDEYVVSGSDSGHLFVWDRHTSELMTILEGDGEVVNVVQGHPYEPMLAVSGIDNTVKIFSPDKVARRNARQGIGVAAIDSSSFSSLRWGRTRMGMARPVPREEARAQDATAAWADEAARRDYDSDETDTEPPHATSGLSSRKRMHQEYEITSRNDHDRRGGQRDAFITRSMLAQLAQQIRMRPGGAGGGGGEGEEGQLGFMLGNGQVVVNTGDCEIM